MSLLRWKQKLFADGGVARGGSSGGGGSPSPGPTQTTVQNTNIPEYAQPYVETMLGAAQQQIFNYDDAGNVTSMKPYTPYSNAPQDYIAGFSPLQQQAQSNIANMQTPGGYGTGADFATTSGLGALSTANTAAQYGGMGAQYGTAGSQYGAAGANQAGMAAQQAARQAQMYSRQGAQAGQQAVNLAPQAQQYGATAADIGLGGLNYGAQGAQTGQEAGALTNMYGGMGAQAGEQAAGQSSMYGGMGAQTGAQAAGQSSMYGGLGAMQGQQGANIGASLGQMSTSPGAVGAYMNPYIQNALAPALALQEQEFGVKNMQNQAQATQQGAFGGGRSAVMQGLNQQNQALAQNQLVGNAYNQAFNNAQQQMNTANQAALSGNQQALAGYGMGLTGAQQAGQLGMAGTAQGLQGAQQAGQLGMAGTAQGLQGAQQAGQLSMAGYGMGQSGAQQAGQLGMQGAQTGLAGLSTAMQGQQAGLSGLGQANQLYGTGISGAGLGLSGVGQQINAGNLGLAGTAQGIQGAQAGMQGAGIGLQGTAAQQAAYQQLGAQGTNLANIAGQQTQSELGINAAQQASGAAQQAQQQNIINQQIQNYATAQQYPMMQLSNMSGLLRGLPMQSATTQTYQAAPSAVSTLGGLGATALGAYGAAGGFKGAKGGLPKDFEKVKNFDVGGAVVADLKDMDIPQLIEQAKTSPSATVRQEAIRILTEKENEAAMAKGVGQAPAAQAMQMAGGGIVAFADGGSAFTDEEMYAGSNRATPLPPVVTDPMQKKIVGLMDLYKNQYGYGQSSEEDKAIREGIKTDRAELKANKDQNLWRALMMGGAKSMASTSPFANVGVGQGVGAGIEEYARGTKDLNEQLKALRSGELDLSKLSSSDRNNLLHYASAGASAQQRAEDEAASRLEVAKTRAADIGGKSADRLQGKILTIAQQLYATDIKANTDPNGIVKLTEKQQDDLYKKALTRAATMVQDINVVGGKGGDGGGKGGTGTMRFDKDGNQIKG